VVDGSGGGGKGNIEKEIQIRRKGMMMIEIPKCPKCRTQKHVKPYRLSKLKTKRVWFWITYCNKCKRVLESSFAGETVK